MKACGSAPRSHGKVGILNSSTGVHLDAIVATGSSFCHSLEHFEAGDAETGQGARMRDAGVVRFAKACPNLIHVSLDGATHLGDESLLGLFENCPKLRYVHFSGNDKVAGNLKGVALDALREKHDMAKQLIKLRLTDQTLYEKKFDKAVKDLSTKRKKLAIEIGNTHERGGSVDTWIGGKLKYGYQAFGGPGGFDNYGGFGGGYYGGWF
ncbi:hypothetical protein ABEF95_015065 [Exophiala dermatitidis]